MGSVIPGKVDPNYRGDLQHAKPIPGTALTVTEGKVVPVNTPSQPFQEQYYTPSWTVTSTAEAAQTQYAERQAAAVASGKLVNNTFTVRNEQDQQEYDQLVAAQERARTTALARQEREKTIEDQRQKNLILGFVPNPLQRFDDPLSRFLANTPMRKQATRWNREMDDAGFLVEDPPMLQTPAAKFVFGVIGGYAEEAQKRPTKFATEMALGFGIGKVFMAGEAKLVSLAAAGKVSQKTATTAPSLVKGAMAGAYLTMLGINVAAQPTPEKKGVVVGESLRELTGLGIGAGLATGWRPRFGMTTQQVKIAESSVEPVKTIDLRETIDFKTARIAEPWKDPIIRGRGSVDYRMVDPMANRITPAERAMIISQYKLTPAEVSLARQSKLSLNDILNLRNRFEVPETYVAPKTKPVVEQARPIVKPPEVVVMPETMVRVRTMSGFVPDIFSTSISRVAPGSKIMEVVGINNRIAPGTIVPSMSSVGIMTDQIVSPDTITRQIVREETMVTTITNQMSFSDTTNQYFNSFFADTGLKTPTTPRAPPVMVPPVFPIPFLPAGGGGGSGGRSRWGFVFGERLSKGDPFNDVFGIMMGGGLKKSVKPSRKKGGKKK